MSTSIDTLPETPEGGSAPVRGGGWLIFSIEELKKYQSLPCCLCKPAGGMPDLIDKDNAESQILQPPPGRRGGMRGRGASTGGPSASSNRNYPARQQQYEKSTPPDRKKFDSQAGNRNYRKDNAVNERGHQRPSTGSGRHRDNAAPTGGEGLNKFTLGDIRKAESTIEKSSMTVGEYVKKVACGEISGEASPAKRSGQESTSIFDQISTRRGSNRMSEWLKPRQQQQQPAVIGSAEQQKLKAGLPKGAVTLEELEKGAKATAPAARPTGDGSNEAGRALLAMIGGGGSSGSRKDENGGEHQAAQQQRQQQQSGMGSVHDETLRILREQQQLRTDAKQHGRRGNDDGGEQMKRLQRQLAQVRTKGQVSPTASNPVGGGQHTSPRKGGAPNGAYASQASQYAQQRAALNQGSRGMGNMPMPAAAPVMPPPAMGAYGQQPPIYDPHQMARRQQHQHQQMAATAAAAAAATRGQRGGFQPQQVDPKWLEELQRRRSLDSASSKREVGRASSGVEEMQESKFEAQPWVQQTLAETDARAQEMGLFVYPSAGNSRWRVFPLGSIAILLAALGVSTELSAITDRRPDVDSTGLVEWTREGSEEAVDYVDRMAVENEDLRAPVTGIISLLTCSLLHPEGDSSGSSRLASAGLLLTSGAIIERLHGPVRFLGAVTAATAVSNLVGLQLSSTDLPLLGSSPAVFFGVGYLSILRPFSMWACLPNLPIPCQWLLAPAVVSLATRAWRLLGSSRSMASVDEDATAPRAYEQLSNRELRRLMSRTAVQLSMLEAAQEGEVDEGRSIGVLYATTGSSQSEVNASLTSLHDQLEALRQEWSARGGWPSDRYAGLISFLALEKRNSCFVNSNSIMLGGHSEGEENTCVKAAPVGVRGPSVGVLSLLLLHPPVVLSTPP
ncbi:hypothetical protein FOZ63_025405 [Perkinsus olseni]|uniref:Uncharacterized protein n=1 Tax=Perkinsus olseni TaxID=32597 RepID=A0A7J6QIM2_PEROL|nr:hypothetical protein FOZ63_025405 [Perkinsus olseni]